ncbi:hypothetical protein NC315_13520 [Streptomyces sp. G2]|uniref:hypothetical protein n=1 Tax=Streptomyces sp. G2 TaxID=1684471 RepID=UPI00202F32A4|nr:hypothetical protein [Streptomyces sp. G2]MCM1946389.1 hypothetical protein [Streptomyces sp. G2]
MSTLNERSAGESHAEKDSLSTGHIWFLPDGRLTIDPNEAEGCVVDIDAAHTEALEIVEAEQRRASAEWYRAEVQRFEEERTYWEEQYEADPPSDEEKILAQELYDAGYLDEIELGRPVPPTDGEEAGNAVLHLMLPPSWLIRQAHAQYTEDLREVRRLSSAGVRLDVRRFSDSDRHLFYRGKLNYLFGKGSAGKTTLLLHVAAEYVLRREHVAWVIFEEMTPDELAEMLERQGVSPVLVDRYFHPVRVTDRKAPVLEHSPALVVIDSAIPCMEHLGYNPTTDAGGISALVTTFFDPYREENPDMTGILIDHVGLSEKAQHRSSGHHSKMDKFQGAVYLLKAERPGMEGDWGYSSLTLAKDNKGKTGVRVDHIAGYLVMDSSGGTGVMNVRLVTEEPTGTSHTPASEQAQNRATNGAKDIARNILRSQGRSADEDWRDAIMSELRAANPGVDDPTLRRRMRVAISDLKRKGHVEQDGDEWVYVQALSAIE